jgi:hypothetical protein
LVEYNIDKEYDSDLLDIENQQEQHQRQLRINYDSIKRNTRGKQHTISCLRTLATDKSDISNRRRRRRMKDRRCTSKGIPFKYMIPI